ncbi:MAG: hypothetical protein PUF41_11680 [Prevotella copri]|nr:hypothetical protein [Segatella copri]
MTDNRVVMCDTGGTYQPTRAWQCFTMPLYLALSLCRADNYTVRKCSAYRYGT